MANQIEIEYNNILKRQKDKEEGSYTNYLFTKGKEKILKKVGEEATEVVIASMTDKKDELVGEICDLTYHVLVLMADMRVSLEDIYKELIKRREKSNNFKGERKPINHL